MDSEDYKQGLKTVPNAMNQENLLELKIIVADRSSISNSRSRKSVEENSSYQ
jgi:hypothetical protein